MKLLLDGIEVARRRHRYLHPHLQDIDSDDHLLDVLQRVGQHPASRAHDTPPQ